jgi:hypothetical protein
MYVCEGRADWRDDYFPGSDGWKDAIATFELIMRYGGSTNILTFGASTVCYMAIKLARSLAMQNLTFLLLYRWHWTLFLTAANAIQTNQILMCIAPLAFYRKQSLTQLALL